DRSRGLPRHRDRHRLRLRHRPRHRRGPGRGRVRRRHHLALGRAGRAGHRRGGPRPRPQGRGPPARPHRPARRRRRRRRAGRRPRWCRRPGEQLGHRHRHPAAGAALRRLARGARHRPRRRVPVPAARRPPDGGRRARGPDRQHHQRARAPAARRGRALLRGQGRARPAHPHRGDRAGRARHHRQRRRPRRDRHPDDRADRLRPARHEPSRGTARPARRRPGGRGRRRLPGLARGVLRHRRVVGRGRRDAADGADGRFAPGVGRLAVDGL
ncbi:MAG: Uncharacterized oxidoreductase YohF, partial [uncultured Pseudonocardia sp.]